MMHLYEKMPLASTLPPIPPNRLDAAAYFLPLDGGGMGGGDFHLSL